MTPFGEKMRALRAERGVALKDMAEALGVTPTYLSALEHGRRGRPNWAFVQRVIHYFNVIWDDAEEIARLADLSHPRIVIDTAGLSSAATAFANRLARNIDRLDTADLERLSTLLAEAVAEKTVDGAA
jgi:transcriptional regulator with XRE-family HTH domain